MPMAATTPTAAAAEILATLTLTPLCPCLTRVDEFTPNSGLALQERIRVSQIDP